MSISCPPDLKERYSQGRVVPFIGAGVSMSVEWTVEGVVQRGPSWKELVDKAADLLGWKRPELLRARGTDLQILEYFRAKHHGRFDKLANWLAGFQPPEQALRRSPIHCELAQLTHCPLYYTTNFDDFLERSFHLNGRAIDVVAEEEDMAHAQHETQVVKFHGDLYHIDRMVLGESHYEHRLALQTAMDFRLRADVLGRKLLFLGYSFRDPNVSYLFRMVAEQFKAFPGAPPSPRAYIVVPDPSDFEIELFDNRGISVIAARSDRLTEDTTQLLRQIRGAE